MYLRTLLLRSTVFGPPTVFQDRLSSDLSYTNNDKLRVVIVMVNVRGTRGDHLLLPAFCCRCMYC